MGSALQSTIILQPALQWWHSTAPDLHDVILHVLHISAMLHAPLILPAGGCEMLLKNFRPQMVLDDLDRDDGFKLVSGVFKIKANDL